MGPNIGLNPDVAWKTITSVIAENRFNLSEHNTVYTALTVIQNIVFPPPADPSPEPVPAPEKKDDAKQEEPKKSSDPRTA